MQSVFAENQIDFSGRLVHGLDISTLQVRRFAVFLLYLLHANTAPLHSMHYFGNLFGGMPVAERVVRLRHPMAVERQQLELD